MIRKNHFLRLCQSSINSLLLQKIEKNFLRKEGDPPTSKTGTDFKNQFECIKNYDLLG
jgi:hypothetical protein